MGIKLIPYAIALILGYLYYAQEPKVIDKTEYYQNQLDSLETIIEAKNRMIDIRDDRISKLNQDNDSLLNYQSKIYRYYAKEKSNIINVPDSAVLSTFTGLLDGR